MLNRVVAGRGVLLGLLVLATAGQANEAAGVDAVMSMGGEVTLDARQPGTPVVSARFHFLNRSVITDAGLRELKELKSLQSLEFIGTGITDSQLKELKAISSLKSLRIQESRISDAGAQWHRGDGRGAEGTQGAQYLTDLGAHGGQGY